MPRMRFLPGLVLGLLFGIVLGAIGVTLILPSRDGGEGATSLQMQQLSRQLESAQRDKEALNRQVDEFRGLAERMTTSFSDLERRFRALEEEMRLRETRERPPAPAPRPEPRPPTEPPPVQDPANP